MTLRGTENAVEVGPLIAHPWCRLWRGAVTAHTLVGVNTNGERFWLNSPDTDKASEQKCSELMIIYRKIFDPLEKCIGHRLKLLDIVQKIWAPLRTVLAPLNDPSWLPACTEMSF